MFNEGGLFEIMVFNENIEKHITEPFIIRPKWLITSIRKTNRC